MKAATSHNYYRVRTNDGEIIEGSSVRLAAGTEAMDGQRGVTDPRFVNEYGFYRRIIDSKTVKAILALAKKECPDSIYHGGDGPRVDDLYSVPVRIISAIDARN